MSTASAASAAAAAAAVTNPCDETSMKLIAFARPVLLAGV